MANDESISDSYLKYKRHVMHYTINISKIYWNQLLQLFDYVDTRLHNNNLVFYQNKPLYFCYNKLLFTPWALIKHACYRVKRENKI